MTNAYSEENVNKTYQEYIDGFGNAAVQDLWIGLDVLHGMTSHENTRFD